ncbi:hypothetical protein [Mitsuaria sp. 7]|uniref:hypothetical protein n=1 Tax=Mitsuaria sp. 7 TaxID=1658665 RepID=UPI0007DD2F44|nr:hypothetical protein [Mitsuaria sp. 7]ANH68047.1 hypothetical protein ABE85_11520 [Mitsuaria sp. 7]
MSPMSFSQAGASGASSAASAASASARFHGPAAFHASLDDELDDNPGAAFAAMALDADGGGGVPPAPPPPMTAAAAPAPRPAKTLFMQRRLLELRPLLRLNNEAFEAFLYQSRMYPTLSRFAPGNVEYCVPRRDITVGLAMKTLRERIEHAAVIAELVCRLKRDDDEEGALCNDDEAVVATAAIRDDLREALGMLGVYEQAIRDGVPVVQYHEPVHEPVNEAA